MEIGGGGEGASTIDYVSNDKDKLIDAVRKGDPNYPLVYTEEPNEDLSTFVDVGSSGEMVGWFYNETEPEDERGVVAVLFLGGTIPEIVE
jgi:hypothetical protein